MGFADLEPHKLVYSVIVYCWGTQQTKIPILYNIYP